MTPIPTSAFVLGTMNLLRPLGLAGIPCVAVAPLGSPTLYSRFTRDRLVWSGGYGAELADALLRAAAREGERPVLVYEKDAQLLFVSRHRDRLAAGFRFLLPPAERVEELVDKSRFAALARRLDLPMPPTATLHPRPGSPVPEHPLRYPIIIKPPMRTAAWTSDSAAKAIRLDGPADLRAHWPRLCALGQGAPGQAELLAQELVPGPETAIVSYHVLTDAAGTILGEFTGAKVRTLPAAYGHTTALVLTDASGAAADVAALGRSLTRRLGLIGPAKFDFKRGPDGRLHLLEVNPRYTLWHLPGALAGLNLPALAHASLTGRPLPSPPAPGQPRQARPGVTWGHPLPDLRAARAAGVPLRDWLRWTVGCDSWSVLAADDPMPALRAALYRIGARLRPGRATAGSAEREAKA